MHLHKFSLHNNNGLDWLTKKKIYFIIRNLLLQIGKGMHLIRCLINTLCMFIEVIMYECIFTFLHFGVLFNFWSHFLTCSLIHILNKAQRWKHSLNIGPKVRRYEWNAPYNYKRSLICALQILGNFLKYLKNLKLKFFCANTKVIRIQHFFIIKTYEKFSNNVFVGLNIT